MSAAAQEDFEDALARLATRLRHLAPDEAVGELARVLRLRVPCDYLSISWVLPEADTDDTLWLAALWADGRCSTSGFALGMRFPVVRGGFDLVFADRRTTSFADVKLDPFHERLMACGIGSGVSQAIGSPVQGILFVGFAERDAPHARHEAALEAVAGVLSRHASDGVLLALEGARETDEDAGRADPREVLLTAARDGRVSWASPSAQALWGMAPERIVGRAVDALLAPVRTGFSLSVAGVLNAYALCADGDRVEVEVLVDVGELDGQRRLRVRDQPTLRRGMEDELRRRNTELRVVGAVAHAAASKPEFADVAADVVALLARHTAADCAAVLRLDGPRVTVVSQQGACDEGVALVKAARASLAGGGALPLGHAPSGAEFLAVGLVTDAGLRGLLLLGARASRPFHKRDHALYRTAGDALAGALGSALRYEALRKQTRDHGELIDSLPAIIFRNRVDWSAEYVSAGVTDILGFAKEEALAPGFTRALLRDNQRQPFAEEMAEHLAHGTPIPWLDLRARHKDGRTVILRTTLRAVRDDDGHLIGVEGVATDATAEREVQRQLVAADRLAALGLLSAGVGHEINNPAAYISLGVQQIRRLSKSIRAGGDAAPLLDRVDATLADMEEGVKRITSIVGELRLFSRSPDAPYSGPTDVNALVRSTAALVATELRSRARLDLSLGEIPPQPSGYQRLSQVFLNLLINAAQAIPNGAPGKHRVEVKSRVDGDHVEVVVHDTGPGIAKELHARIFDPFFTTKPPSEGTGLGLAISFDVVKQLGGQLTMASRPGEGCTFTVRVPSLPYDVPGFRGGTDVARAEQATGPRGRVLVVDDERALATSIGWELERLHDVEVAFSAEEALERIERAPSHASGNASSDSPGDAPFDAIVCDLRMPGMSGPELFVTVGTRHPELARRFVFLTGVAAAPEEARFLSAVGAPVIEKPFALDELWDALDQVLAD